MKELKNRDEEIVHGVDSHSAGNRLGWFAAVLAAVAEPHRS
jgi:hypothetical protein